MKRLLPFAALLAAIGPMTAAEAPRGLRDPMQAPISARASSPAAADTPAPVNLTARHLLVVDGRRYVVDGNRRRAVGDMLGDARIERIEDAAVVVRNAAGTQRLPLFGGVVKQAAADPNSTASDRPTGRPTTSPGAQP
jgi:hypothetical protein